MKKIAFITSLKYGGGTELSLLNLLKRIPKGKYDITLLLIGEIGELQNEIPKEIKIRIIEAYNYRQRIGKLLMHGKIIESVQEVIKILIRKGADTTDGMERYSKIMSAYEQVSEPFDIAITWSLPNSIHTAYTLENVCAKKKWLWVHMDVTHDKPPADAERYFQQYDRIVCVSYACKAQFDITYPQCKKKTLVFYNILNVSEIIAKSNKDVILDGKFKIVTCGRISSEKQPLHAISITKKLISSGVVDFKWYFVGEGILEREMVNEIKRNNLSDYIIILGRKNNPYPYVRAADLYVQMSRHESFCLTLAESQILDIPAVSTCFPAAYEIIQNGKTGYIVENSPDALYEKIYYLIQNRSELLKMKRELHNTTLQANGDIEKFISLVDSERTV